MQSQGGGGGGGGIWVITHVAQEPCSSVSREPCSSNSKGPYNSIHKEPDSLEGQVAKEPYSSGAM